MKELKIWREKN